MAVLLYYYRLFTTYPMLGILRAFGAGILMWEIASTLVGIFQCVPVSSFFDKTLPGHCVDTYAWVFAEGLITIGVDIALLILPIIYVWKLHFNMRQKAGLALIFLVGILYVPPSLSSSSRNWEASLTQTVLALRPSCECSTSKVSSRMTRRVSQDPTAVQA